MLKALGVWMNFNKVVEFPIEQIKDTTNLVM